MNTLPWRKQAVCAEVDSELFFPEKGQHGIAKRAKKICNTVCPVREQCLEAALQNGEQYGIWGGKSARELAVVKAERKRDRLLGSAA